MNVAQKDNILSLFARRQQQVVPLNIETQPIQNENTQAGQVVEELVDKDQKLAVKQKRTFLISSIQPSIRARDIFKKALLKKKEMEKVKVKTQNVIKMSIVYIEKFIRLMKQQSSVIRFRQGGLNQLNIIGDKASDYKYYLVNNYFEKEVKIKNIFQLKAELEQILFKFGYFDSNKYFLNIFVLKQRNHLYFYSSTESYKITLMIKYLSYNLETAIYIWMKANIVSKLKLDEVEYLILPNSKIYMIWSTFLLVVLSLNVLYVPVAISFVDIKLSTFAEVCINIIPNACFMIEILVKFNTGKLSISYRFLEYKIFIAIYKKGLIIKSRKQIVLSYMKGRFWYDLLIVFCFFVGSYFQNPYIQTVLLLRYFDITRLIGDLEDRYNLRERFYGIMDLVKLILFILFIAHLCGCVWHEMAVIEIDNGYNTTWIGQGELALNSNWKDRYVDSLYWAVVTMCTLGYGDIVPVTSTEKLFTIGVTLISCFVFGYSVNQIGDILKEFLRIEEEFKVKMAKLNMYMKKRELNDDVSVKVRKYFEYLHKEELQSNTEGATLIDSLEIDLKQEVLRDIYGKLLRTKKLFKLNFDVDSLSIKIKEKTVGLHEYIYKEGDDPNCIYFLLKGQAEIIKTQTNTTLQVIEKGMMFGEIEFFTGQLRQYAIRSNSVSQIAYFNREDFVEILQNRKPDYEKFKKMQDLLYVYSDTQGLDHQCGSCGKYTHLLMNCPQINVVLNRQKTLSTYNFQVNQERKNDFKRNRSRYTCRLSKIALVQQLAYKFYENEKLQLLELYEEDEDEAIINSNNNIMNNRSPNDDKKASWNQFGEKNPRKKSQIQLIQQNEGQMRDKRESLVVINPQRKSRLSMMQQNRTRKISRAELQPSLNTQQNILAYPQQQQLQQQQQQQQDQKYSINIVKDSPERKSKDKLNEPPTKESSCIKSQSIRKSFLDDDIEYSNFESHMTMGELLSKNKKRGLMPSFFENKRIFSPKSPQQDDSKYDLFKSKNKINHEGGNITESQSQQKFTELNDLQQKLRNKSTISISSDSSSDEYSSGNEKNNNNNISTTTLNKQKQELGIPQPQDLLPANQKQSIPSLNQQDIINKLMNGGSSENIKEEYSLKQHNFGNSNLVTRDNSQSDSQKAIFQLGVQHENSKPFIQLGDKQNQLQQDLKIAQQLFGGSFKQLEDDYNNSKNLIIYEQNLLQQGKRKQSSKQSMTKQLEDRKSILAVDDLSLKQNSRTSVTQISDGKKRSITGQPSPQLNNLKRISGSNLQNYSTPNIVIQPVSDKINTQNLNQNPYFYNNNNPYSSEIQKKMFGSGIANSRGVQDVRRKVSILVSRNGTQDVQQVTLSVNQKEQDQLREILQIESQLMQGSMLKKTLPRKLNSRLRSRSNELLDKIEKKEKQQRNPSQQQNDEVDGEEDDEKSKNGYVFNIPSLNNLDSASYHLNVDNQFSNSQVNQRNTDDYDEEADYFNISDQLELRKYEQIFLKKYDEEFIQQFEKGREYKEYFPKNNVSNVLEMISIRRKLNPFYRVLLLRKRAKTAKNARPLNRSIQSYRKPLKNLNMISKSFYGASFLKQSYSVNSAKGLTSPLNN